MLTPAGGKLMFLFSDIESGKRFGYSADGWVDASRQHYRYTGEGAIGPQQFERRNRTLLNAAEDGREVHLFIAAGRVPGRSEKVHEYQGQFELEKLEPWTPITMPDQDGDLRTAIVFNLQRVGAGGAALQLEASPISKVLDRVSVQIVSREASDQLQSQRVAVKPLTAFRRERLLENQLIELIERRGESAKRLRIDIRGEVSSLVTDTWVPETRTLFEVKADSTCKDIRMAIAQLLDYRRHIDPAPERCVIVVPIAPSQDLCELVHECGLELAVLEHGHLTYGCGRE
ncbi:hypothetical protein MUN77_13965 [Leucobacter allii]|uniref:hypothetical protein n=1 Tax=Leucobacter allii TaxID=2932247 RepID=UPI001FD5ED58|nr:hypothetical protein [Leucobacter allii]UOR01222.1 hypothetical protein MUN77_13965 [Leucobacter allii]